MKRDNSQQNNGITGPDFSAEDALRLLTKCVLTERRPVDELVDRLRADDAEAWFSHALDLEGLTLAQQQELLNGGMSRNELLALKEASKTHVAEAFNSEQGLAALLVYCLSVASAQAHAGELPSSQPRELWDQTWVQIADVAPTKWRDLLLKAAGAA